MAHADKGVTIYHTRFAWIGYGGLVTGPMRIQRREGIFSRIFRGHACTSQNAIKARTELCVPACLCTRALTRRLSEHTCKHVGQWAGRAIIAAAAPEGS